MAPSTPELYMPVYAYMHVYSCICTYICISMYLNVLVLYCWHFCGSHVVHRVENLRLQKRRTWTSLVMAPSTAELYTPRREYNGPNCALSGFAENSGSFAENSGKLAENSGIATQESDEAGFGRPIF